MTIRRIDDNNRDELDAVVHLRSARRCHLERRGLDSIMIAVHLLAETGDLPGWDDAIDNENGDDSDWEWAA
ncbi:hypothetical protein [Nocardia sp. CA-135398]|uniref:hypothetical protein n=1 Tax=Nocardia sp. CA-135398 TaxID=3239977 RepID=UPI003D97B7E5